MTGRVLHGGTATGELLVLDAPLSFWGGVDATGTIVDATHPQCGQRLTGRVVVMPPAKGSSSSTSVVAEQLRAGTAPAAVVLTRADPIIVLGALVAAELYAVAMPALVVTDLSGLPTSGWAAVLADGEPGRLRVSAG
ncbi:MAG: DUF126 domain-containing protein [Streptosporangiales bacterium]|nr:DUF126 domain-containing protein [Streptosporangiales bacterium]